jgi:hypothetical protein
MTEVDWEHCKHPLPENVYDTCMRYWQGSIDREYMVERLRSMSFERHYVASHQR